MRIKDVRRHEELLAKYAFDDDLYEFIDLTYLVYRRVETELDFADYLRDMMSLRTQPQSN